MSGDVVWVGRATEGIQDAYLDLRTGALIRTGGDAAPADPTNWGAAVPHYVPFGHRGDPAGTEYFRIVSEELPELRC